MRPPSQANCRNVRLWTHVVAFMPSRTLDLHGFTIVLQYQTCIKELKIVLGALDGLSALDVLTSFNVGAACSRSFSTHGPFVSATRGHPRSSDHNSEDPALGHTGRRPLLGASSSHPCHTVNARKARPVWTPLWPRRGHLETEKQTLRRHKVLAGMDIHTCSAACKNEEV